MGKGKENSRLKKIESVEDNEFCVNSYFIF